MATIRPHAVYVYMSSAKINVEQSTSADISPH